MVIALAILVLFPFILVLSLREEWHKPFFYFARFWGKMVLVLMGFRLKVKYLDQINWKQPSIIIANHASEIDIMTTLAIAKGTWLFIGKKELAKFPLFGYFYKRTNILVDRSSPRSRREVYLRAKKKMDEGFGICIYPEGGIPDPSWRLVSFKPGAFRIAAESGYPIIPITFVDNKEKFPEEWSAGRPGTLRCVVHPPMYVNSEKDIDRLQRDAYQIMAQTLREYNVDGKEENK